MSMTLSTNNSSLDLSLVFNNLKSNARNVSRTNAAERVAKLKKLENYLREPKI
jgi:hypothetical protein